MAGNTDELKLIYVIIDNKKPSFNVKTIEKATIIIAWEIWPEIAIIKKDISHNISDVKISHPT